MSEQSTLAAAVDVPSSAEEREAKRKQAEQVLAEILERMEWPARLDLKDAEDGGISVALHSEIEIPGAQVGKRSFLVDSLQLVVNKIVNRLPADRRWIAIGLGEHPAPRNAERPARKAKPAPAVQMASPPSRPLPPPRGNVASGEGDERTLSVSSDPDLHAVSRLLAERSALLGRFYAVVGMKREERACMVQAVEQSGECRVSIEGEGRQRRVIFTPANPSPMPKRVFPIDDDDDLGDD